MRRWVGVIGIGHHFHRIPFHLLSNFLLAQFSPCDELANCEE